MTAWPLKLLWSTRLIAVAARSMRSAGTAPPPCTWASTALPAGTSTGAGPGGSDRNCGGRPVYCGGDIQTSRLTGACGPNREKSGWKARPMRARQSPPAINDAHHQRQRQHAAQPIGIAAHQPGARESDAQAPDRGAMRARWACHKPAASPPLCAAGEPVLERGERAVGEPARGLDAPPRGLMRRQAETPQQDGEIERDCRRERGQQAAPEASPAASPARRTAPRTGKRRARARTATAPAPGTPRSAPAGPARNAAAIPAAGRFRPGSRAAFGHVRPTHLTARRARARSGPAPACVS